jgi:Cu(I)/Ag(I) efflux system periplasmic protein CusF
MSMKFAITAMAWLASMPLLATDMTDGEVRKVDLEQGKVTLRHEEIKDLDMPRMTMVFVVKDKAQLAQLKPGDKVKFRAVNESGKFTVTDIQTVR